MPISLEPAFNDRSFIAHRETLTIFPFCRDRIGAMILSDNSIDSGGR
ncbi:MAG: hypothetical protein Q4A75_05915 [Peptostreptococcaceae bacterium]|nr:hypothetical protein [Peptostreptococcaceae bacterium]